MTDVVLSGHAVDDLTEARDHYASIGPELGDDFMAAIDAVMERISVFPNGAPSVSGFPGLRRARVRRFPYGVFYRPGVNGPSVVIRVLHRAQSSAGLETP